MHTAQAFSSPLKDFECVPFKSSRWQNCATFNASLSISLKSAWDSACFRNFSIWSLAVCLITQKGKSPLIVLHWNSLLERFHPLEQKEPILIYYNFSSSKHSKFVQYFKRSKDHLLRKEILAFDEKAQTGYCQNNAKNHLFNWRISLSNLSKYLET